MIAVVSYLYFIYVLNNHTVSHTAASSDDVQECLHVQTLTYFDFRAVVDVV